MSLLNLLTEILRWHIGHRTETETYGGLKVKRCIFGFLTVNITERSYDGDIIVNNVTEEGVLLLASRKNGIFVSFCIIDNCI